MLNLIFISNEESMSKNCIFENPAVEHEGFFFSSGFPQRASCQTSACVQKKRSPDCNSESEPSGGVPIYWGTPIAGWFVMEYPIKNG